MKINTHKINKFLAEKLNFVILRSFPRHSVRFAKKERINKQYYAFSQLSLDDAKGMITLSEKFNEERDLFIDKISLENIKIYRSKFQKIIK